MNKLHIILFFLLFSSTFGVQATSPVPVVKFNELEPLLHEDNDTVYIINFWATWCVPCRKELPYFEEIHARYSNEKVKVILISLDFVSRMESALLPFIEQNKITAPVILLNDPNSNEWIDKVDADWSGALPATLVYRAEKRKFYEQELDYIQLENIIHEFTKN